MRGNFSRHRTRGAFGPAYVPAQDVGRLRTQMQTIREVMLSAADCGTWLTLREIAALTHYGEASISAQLRHLRKPQFGRYVLEKRRRGSGGTWEYRLLPPRLGEAAHEELTGLGG